MFTGSGLKGRLLIRSGNWNNGALTGLFSFNVNNAVSYSGNVNYGFRLALLCNFVRQYRLINRLGTKKGKGDRLPSV